LTNDFKIFSPNGRLGDPKEVGYLALFLASDLARYISGAAIPIDAGFQCRQDHPCAMGTSRNIGIVKREKGDSRGSAFLLVMDGKS
jgi:hypothetical protein